MIVKIIKYLTIARVVLLAQAYTSGSGCTFESTLDDGTPRLGYVVEVDATGTIILVGDNSNGMISKSDWEFSDPLNIDSTKYTNDAKN